MKKLFIIILLLVAIDGMAEYDVVGMSISRSGDNTIVEVLSTSQTNIKTGNLTRPDRLLIDLIGGIHRLKTLDYPALPPGIIIEFRSAQNQAKPEPITRIVLVLAEKVEEVNIENGPRSGKVIIPTPGYSDFETWSIGRETPQVKKEETVTEEPKEREELKQQTLKADKEISDTAKSAEDIIEKPAKDEIDKEIDSLAIQERIQAQAESTKAIFKRPEIKYNGRENRDPFILVHSSTERKFGSEAVPSVDALKLVGVVKGVMGQPLAVLEDNRKWGYILGIGDTIVNGIVGEISDSTVRFDITEYGMTRPVILGLMKEAQKK